MAIREFRLPDPGEGLLEAEVVQWKVAVGDVVKVNDVVVEVETAKSLVELPIPYAGTVAGLLVEEGEEVAVGTVIITIEDGVAVTEPSPEAAGATGDGPDAGAVEGPDETPGVAGDGASEPGAADDEEPVKTLVGYGPKAAVTTRRPRRSPDVAAAPEVVQTLGGERLRVLATPPVRALARELGLDLASVAPTGPGGVVTRDDVHAAAVSGPPTEPAFSDSGARPASSSWDEGPREVRQPIKGVRKATAAAMVASAFTAPHVTEWVDVDVTQTMALIARLRTDREFNGVKLTPLTILAKAVCLAVRRHPAVNAMWDEAAGEIVHKRYVNLGIAAATPRGLIVPNIPGADRLTLVDLARAVLELATTAREGRTSPAAQAGGTITITNIGVFGIDGGTPIINPPEAAILALGQVRRRPWVVTRDGVEGIEVRSVATLSLSFDHRLIDGELGSRFLADVAALLTDPARALTWS